MFQAGHLLGSAFELVGLSDGRTILFGGDLGR
jgi:Cft2 family RNA processing exonuclease